MKRIAIFVALFVLLGYKGVSCASLNKNEKKVVKRQAEALLTAGSSIFEQLSNAADNFAKHGIIEARLDSGFDIFGQRTQHNENMQREKRSASSFQQRLRQKRSPCDGKNVRNSNGTSVQSGNNTTITTRETNNRDVETLARRKRSLRTGPIIVDHIDSRLAESTAISRPKRSPEEPFDEYPPNGSPPNGLPANGTSPNGPPPNGPPPDGPPPNGPPPNGPPPDGPPPSRPPPNGPPPNGPPPNGPPPDGLRPNGPPPNGLPPPSTEMQSEGTEYSRSKRFLEVSEKFQSEPIKSFRKRRSAKPCNGNGGTPGNGLPVTNIPTQQFPQQQQLPQQPLNGGVNIGDLQRDQRVKRNSGLDDPDNVLPGGNDSKKNLFERIKEVIAETVKRVTRWVTDISEKEQVTESQSAFNMTEKPKL